MARSTHIRAFAGLGAIFTLQTAFSQPARAQTSTVSVALPATATVATATATITKAALGGDRLRDVLVGADLTGTPTGPKADAPLPPAPVDPDQLPNYDGRPPPPTNAGRVLAWVPRVLFFPVHLVLEYLVRTPIIWSITRFEEYKVQKRIERLFSFRDGKSIIYPTFLADFGVNPAVGLTNRNTDLFWRGHTLRGSVAVWDPDDWLRAAVQSDSTFLENDSAMISFYANYLRRPDLPFYGVGPLTSSDDRVRYRIGQTLAGMRLEGLFADLSRLSFETTLRDVRFSEDANGPAIDFDAARLRWSNNFPPRYQLLELRGMAHVDTRDPDTEFGSGSGIRLEGFGSFEFDPTNNSRNFLRWGGEAAGFLDLGLAHVIALRVYTEMTERTGTDQIPFTELPALGGLETMRGYLGRRFVGDSTFEATFSYRYPVWSLLDAEVFASLGNAFDGHLQKLSPKRMYFNSGLSLRTNLDRDVAFNILIAVGTNRLDQEDVVVDSVRFAFGVTQGF